MSDPGTTGSKRDISKELWEIIETLSDDAQQVTLRKAKELGFDLNKGTIPFDETLINLCNNRDILHDAIHRARLPQLPLKIQETLLTDSKKVSGQLAAIANGNDAIIPLESAVEDLTASVWYSGLQNLTGSILGFEKKLNQLKTLESTIGAAKRQAEEFVAKEAKAVEKIQQLEKLSIAADRATEKINNTVAEVEATKSRLKESEQQSGASLASVQQSAKTANDGAAAIGVHASETEASTKRAKELLDDAEVLRAGYKTLEEGLRILVTTTEAAVATSQNSHETRLATIEENAKTQIDSLRTSTEEAVEAFRTETSAKIVESLTALRTENDTFLATMRQSEEDRVTRAKKQLLSSNEEFVTAADAAKESYRVSSVELQAKATQIIDENNKELNRLTSHLSELEEIIHEKIQLATNFQLFHSFQTRQFSIARSKRFWGWALAACVLASLGLSSYFIWYLQHVQVFNTAFYMKLSISLPIVYAITFCSLQFSHERRLEEEYAFKANISISLDPYRKLVAELIDVNNPVEKAKYSDFVIESINRVFTSPTSHGSDEKPTDDIVTGVIKEVGNIITPLAKIIRR